MQLSQNFHLDEFTRSETASRMGLNNNPSQAEINNLRSLCNMVLQPVRDYFEQPVIITSGYRSPAVNSAVGGSSSSQHMSGQAADFNIAGMDNHDLASWISSNLNYDQLILEFYTGGTSGWVHCSHRNSGNRKQDLTINNRGTFNGLKRY